MLPPKPSSPGYFPLTALPALHFPMPRTLQVHWLGAAFGLTQELLNYWTRLGFQPVYLRQTASDVTGECSTIVLRALGGVEEQGSDAEWAKAFAKDFRVRCSQIPLFCPSSPAARVPAPGSSCLHRPQGPCCMLSDILFAVTAGTPPFSAAPSATTRPRSRCRSCRRSSTSATRRRAARHGAHGCISHLRCC